jgi:hypothetical protein
MSEDSAREVRALLERYAEALSRIDVPALRALWDTDALGPFHVVDELHRPILTWPDLEHQWLRLSMRLSSVRVTVLTSDVRELKDGIAIAYGVADWTYVGVDDDDVRSGTSRLSAVATRASDGAWRLAALVESPLHVAPEAPSGGGGCVET